ncbi:MAG TPA: MFS transporter [Bacilli bacterium]|nr:MFS transporter [Bacilli bacterium]
MWQLLKDPRMRRIVLANLFSSVGSGITMIGVPWLIVHRANGDEVFGYTTLATTFLLFFASPYIGALIDRFSRKKLLLASEVISGTSVAVFAVWGFLSGHFETWQLIGVYFGGSLYYSIHFPTQFAFTQEIFTREQYKSLNSVLEVQNQSASMIAGGLASLLIDHVDYSWILMADALTYVAGFLLFLSIPYQRIRAEEENGAATSMWQNIGEGFRYLKERPLLTLFFLCALMPFIGVMLGNYLFPVYVTNVLRSSAAVLGGSDMIYAFGAALAGLTVPLLIRKMGSYGTVVVTFVTFTLSILTMYLFPAVGVFLAFKIFNGWGNAGTRVARNTIMMETVPNHVMGRVNSFFSAAGMGMRVLVIGSATQIVAYAGAEQALLMLVGLLAVAFLGVFTSRKLFSEPVCKNPSNTLGNFRT